MLVLGFSGTSSVQNLQQALQDLSRSANWPSVNPGPVSGQMNPQTVQAVGMVVGSLPDLDKGVRSAVQAAVIVAGLSTTAMSTAQQLCTQYADWLVSAIKALTLRYVAPTQVPPQPSPTGYNTPLPGYPSGYYPTSPPPTIVPAAVQPFFRANNPLLWGAIIVTAAAGWLLLRK